MHLTWLFAAIACLSAASDASAVRRDANDGHWVTSWTAVPESSPADRQPIGFYYGGVFAENSTIRQTLRMTLGAEYIRLRFSNAFGEADLPITKVMVALPRAELEQNVTGSSGIYPDTLQTLEFGGEPSVIIPAGALAVSDPIRLPTEAGQVLGINIYLRDGQTSEVVTIHRVSRTHSFFAHGDETETEGWVGLKTKQRESWYFLSAVEAWKPADFRAFCIFGDSITDGAWSSINANARWTDFLFDRMQTKPDLQRISVLNQGAAGNRELSDGMGTVNAISRIDRDLLAVSGLAYALMFTGMNDIGSAPPAEAEQAEVADRLIKYYKQTITRVHAFGVPVFAGTMPPVGCPTATWLDQPEFEKTRRRMNEWIRTSGAFDAVVDFDKALRDPRNHSMVNVELNVGDCVHPNDAGYKAMAGAFPIKLFDAFKDGVHSMVPGETGEASGGSSSSSSSSSWAPNVASVFENPIATYFFGLLTSVLIVLGLYFVFRRRLLSWVRTHSLPSEKLQHYRDSSREDEAGSALELLNPKEFEEADDHSDHTDR